MMTLYSGRSAATRRTRRGGLAEGWSTLDFRRNSMHDAESKERSTIIINSSGHGFIRKSTLDFLIFQILLVYEFMHGYNSLEEHSNDG